MQPHPWGDGCHSAKEQVGVAAEQVRGREERVGAGAVGAEGPPGLSQGKEEEVMGGLSRDSGRFGVLSLLGPCSRWKRAVREAPACCLRLSSPLGFLEASHAVL